MRAFGSWARRSASARKCATGHCLSARPAPGLIAIRQSWLFTPCSPRKSSMRALGRGQERHVELDRARGHAERREQREVLVDHVDRAGGRAHAPVR